MNEICFISSDHILKIYLDISKFPILPSHSKLLFPIRTDVSPHRVISKYVGATIIEPIRMCLHSAVKVPQFIWIYTATNSICYAAGITSKLAGRLS